MKSRSNTGRLVEKFENRHFYKIDTKNVTNSSKISFTLDKPLEETRILENTANHVYDLIKKKSSDIPSDFVFCVTNFNGEDEKDDNEIKGYVAYDTSFSQHAGQQYACFEYDLDVYIPDTGGSETISNLNARLVSPFAHVVVSKVFPIKQTRGHSFSDHLGPKMIRYFLELMGKEKTILFHINKAKAGKLINNSGGIRENTVNCYLFRSGSGVSISRVAAETVNLRTYGTNVTSTDGVWWVRIGTESDQYADIVKRAETNNFPVAWIGDHVKQTDDGFWQLMKLVLQEEQIDENCPEEGKTQIPFQNQPHQRLVELLFRPFSPMKKLLIVHRTGSGKTKQMVDMLDRFYFDNRKKLLLFPSDGIRDQFYNDELMKSQTRLRYFLEHKGVVGGIKHGAKNPITKRFGQDQFNTELNTPTAISMDFVQSFGACQVDSSRLSSRISSMNQFFDLTDKATPQSPPVNSILTLLFNQLLSAIEASAPDITPKKKRPGFDNFYNDLEKGDITINLDDSLIIIDEAHIIVLQEKYQEIVNLIKNAKNTYVALFTATPVKDLKDFAKYKEIFNVESEDTSNPPLEDLRNFITFFGSGKGVLFPQNCIVLELVETTDYYTMREKVWPEKIKAPWRHNIIVPYKSLFDRKTKKIQKFPPGVAVPNWPEQESKQDFVKTFKESDILSLMVEQSSDFFPLGSATLKKIQKILGTKNGDRVFVVTSGMSGLEYLSSILKNNQINHVILGTDNLGYKDLNLKQIVIDGKPTMNIEPNPQTGRILDEKIKAAWNDGTFEQNGVYVMLYVGINPEGFNIYDTDHMIITHVFEKWNDLAQVIGRINRMCRSKSRKQKKIQLLAMKHFEEQMQTILAELKAKQSIDEQISENSRNYTDYDEFLAANVFHNDLSMCNK